MRTTLLFIFLWFSQSAFSQHILKAVAKDEETREPLIGANVIIDSLRLGGATDMEGKIVIPNIPAGNYTIRFSYIGYAPRQLRIAFPQAHPERTLTVLLEKTAIKSEEITVSATRTNGVVEDSPVRVEVLGFDEIREETAIKPGNITKLLGETSGIDVQQTSATSGSVSLRLQGLQGKYTQLLKDGFPLYGGFSSSLSLLQIPPLDLQQVEVIKGAASALYGGDAIAGLVNLVSRKPAPETEWTIIFDQTHKGGRDLSSFYSTQSGKAGVTFLASQSSQNAFDVDKDGFTDLPEFRQTILNPKFFYSFNTNTKLMLGLASSFETREGGNLSAVENAPDSLHAFIEKSQSNRLTTQLQFEKTFRNDHQLIFKNSFNHFHRDINVTTIDFRGDQLSIYSELSYLLKAKKHDTVFGLNYVTDAFDDQRNFSANMSALDYRHATAGIFVHDEWKMADRLSLHSGLRGDVHNVFGTFVLPRMSALWKISGAFSARLGAGMGYKIPTIFTSEAEGRAFHGVLPVATTLQAETSHGVNLDLSGRFVAGDMIINVNQAFYYTRLRHPLVPSPSFLQRGLLAYENTGSPLISKGLDTNLHVALEESELYVDYTYTAVQANDSAAGVEAELTPKHKLNLDLIVEAEQNWRAGFEAFYIGRQYLGNQTWSRDFWLIGLMFQKTFGEVAIIGNVENAFDVRQSRYEKVVLPPYDRPTFRPLYAPLDGVVANAALEIKIR